MTFAECQERYSGGGSSAKLVLNNDQILTFGASVGPPTDDTWIIPIIPATWVAADGGIPPEMFILTSVSIFLNQTVDGAYSSDPEVAFCYAGNGGSQIIQGVSLALDQGESSFVFSSDPPDPARIDGVNLLIDNGIWFENLALTGSFTGGNASNTLTIIVYYHKISLT